MLLIHKPCKFKKCKNKSFSVYGSNKYCKNHTIHLCKLNHCKNIFNEIRCNTTVEMMEFNNNLYCNSHYRTLISKCSHENCDSKRNTNYLSTDKKWYCDEHIKEQENKFLVNMIHAFEEKNIPSEITKIIVDKHKNMKSYYI